MNAHAPPTNTNFMNSPDAFGDGTAKLLRELCHSRQIEKHDPWRCTMIYRGSCHCGAIRFEVEAPEHLEADECNCSICTRSGFLHLIVPKSRFKLISGQECITTYQFNTGIAKHTFCKVCGIKPFYIPRSNPDGIDVNVRCLDDSPASLSITPFDGRNWEKNAHKVAHKSRESR